MTTLMEKDDMKDIMERILDLTLEIICLLTGETFPPVKSGDHVTITVTPPSSMIYEEDHKKMILEVIHKIMELLTGEEREYLEGHEELYKEAMMGDLQKKHMMKDLQMKPKMEEHYEEAMMEERPPLEGHEELYKEAMMEGQPMDGSRDRIPSEGSPCPLSQDSTHKEQHYKDEELEYKIEEAEEEREGSALPDQPYKEEEMLTEIGTDGRITRLPLNLSPKSEVCDNDYRPSDPSKPEESPPALNDPSTLHQDLYRMDRLQDLCHLTNSSPDTSDGVISNIHPGLYNVGRSPDLLKDFSPNRSSDVMQSSTRRGRKMYQCPECGKCFKQSGNLIVHRRVHTGEKPFQCPQCGKAFAHRSNLVQHQIVHKRQAPYSVYGSDSTTIEVGRHQRTFGHNIVSPDGVEHNGSRQDSRGGHPITPKRNSGFHSADMSADLYNPQESPLNKSHNFNPDPPPAFYGAGSPPDLHLPEEFFLNKTCTAMHSGDKSPDISNPEEPTPNQFQIITPNTRPEFYSANRSPTVSNPEKSTLNKSRAAYPNTLKGMDRLPDLSKLEGPFLNKSQTISPNTHPGFHSVDKSAFERPLNKSHNINQKPNPSLHKVDMSPDLSILEGPLLSKSHSINPNTHKGQHSVVRSPEHTKHEGPFLNKSQIMNPNTHGGFHSMDRSPDLSKLNGPFRNNSHTINPNTQKGLHKVDRSPDHSGEGSSLKTLPTVNPNTHPGLLSVHRSPDLPKAEGPFLSTHTMNPNTHRGLHGVDRPPDLSKLERSFIKDSHAIHPNTHKASYSVDRSPDLSKLEGPFLHKSQTVHPNTHPRLHGVDRSQTVNPNTNPGFCSVDKSTDLSKLEESFISKSHAISHNVHQRLHGVDRSPDLPNLEGSSLNKSHTISPNTHRGFYSVDRPPDPSSKETTFHKLKIDTTQAHPPIVDQKPDIDLMSESPHSSRMVTTDHDLGLYNAAGSADASGPKEIPPSKPHSALRLPHKGQKSYQCPECGKSFKQSGNLIVHRRIHTGEKPFQCLHCGKAFAHRSNLVQHQIVHRGQALPSAPMGSIGFSPALGLGRRQRKSDTDAASKIHHSRTQLYL